MIGKWHLGFCNKKFWPQSRGFDTFYGYLTGHEGYYDHSHDGGYDFRDGDQVAVEANGTYSTQLMAERAAAVIRDHDPAAPLFLYVAFQSVHGGAEQRLEVPRQYEDLYPGVRDPGRRAYLGMVSAMDEAVGGIVASLRARGLYEDSVIVWLSDNGGPGRGQGSGRGEGRMSTGGPGPGPHQSPHCCCRRRVQQLAAAWRQADAVGGRHPHPRPRAQPRPPAPAPGQLADTCHVCDVSRCRRAASWCTCLTGSPPSSPWPASSPAPAPAPWTV